MGQFGDGGNNKAQVIEGAVPCPSEQQLLEHYMADVRPFPYFLYKSLPK